MICFHHHITRGGGHFMSVHLRTSLIISKKCLSMTTFQGKSIANAYASFRPVYPETVKTEIIKYANSNNKFKNDLAYDLGCGSGQSTLMWTDVFKQVIGSDLSQAQIDHAPKGIPNVRFELGSAEVINAEDNTVDLVTIAQAMHWVDTEKAYAEIKRVLKPGGVFAPYGYGNLYLNNPKATEILSKEFYQDKLHGGGYWESGRGHIDNKYADFTPLPFEDFLRVDDLKMEKNWSLDEFIGYVSSWSGYRRFLNQHPHSTILDDLKHSLQALYSEDEKLVVTWPIFILLGRKD